jgi:hypothetical protein
MAAYLGLHLSSPSMISTDQPRMPLFGIELIDSKFGTVPSLPDRCLPRRWLAPGDADQNGPSVLGNRKWRGGAAARVRHRAAQRRRDDETILGNGHDRNSSVI